MDDPKIVRAKQSFRDRLRAKYCKDDDTTSLSSRGSTSPAPPTGTGSDSDNGSVRGGIVRRLSKANPFKPNKSDDTPSAVVEEEVEMKQMKSATTPPPSDKHLPNLPYFERSQVNGVKPKLNPQNSGKRMMNKIGGMIKNKVRRNSLRRGSSASPPQIESGHHPYPQSVLDGLHMDNAAMNGVDVDAVDNGGGGGGGGGNGNEVDQREAMEVDFEEFLRQTPDLEKLRFTADQVV